MIQPLWIDENRKVLVCVDSYENSVFKGRFYNAYRGMETFDSLAQFLVRMEEMLEENRVPQSYTTSRTFSNVMQPDCKESEPLRKLCGSRATFELRILFRQNSSWQGTIVWQDKKIQRNFRSVLELVLLMDSALRNVEGCEAV